MKYMELNHILLEKKLKLHLLIIILLISLSTSCKKGNESIKIWVYYQNEFIILENPEICKTNLDLYLRVRKENKSWYEIIKNKEIDSISIEYKEHKKLGLPLNNFSSERVIATWMFSAKQNSNHLFLLRNDNYEYLEILYNGNLKDDYFKKILAEVPQCTE